MFAYVGLGPGQEFIPYFLALLAFIWAAVIAVLQWPFLVFLRWVRGRGSRTAEPAVTVTPVTPATEAVKPPPVGAEAETPRQVASDSP